MTSGSQTPLRLIGIYGFEIIRREGDESGGSDMTYRAIGFAAAAAFLAISGAAAAQQLEERVQSLEEKTGYFDIGRVSKKKTWKHVRLGNTRDATVDLDYEVPIGGTDPVVTNAWLHVVGDVSFNGDTTAG